MRTVVLMGFSTAGKSTILKRFKSKYNQQIMTIDTDAKIASKHGNHIYNVFFKMVNGNDTRCALEYIKRREREILESLEPDSTPCLIAAGPILPAREPQWTLFVQRVNPICFYLELTAEEVYEGLCKRRDRHINNGLNSRPEFDCWDKDVTTEFKNGKWILLSEDRALRNIRKQMLIPVQVYKKYCKGRTYRARDVKCNTALQDELDRRIAESLKLIK